jgi:hypothetical protein
MRLGTVLVAVGIAATIVAFGFVAWFVIHPTPSMSAPGAQVDFPPLYLAGPVGSYHDGFYVYNFSILQVSPGLTWGQVHLNFSSPPHSTNSSVSVYVNLTVLNASNGAIAVYGIQSTIPTWTVGASATPTEIETLVLTSSLSTPLVGNTLWVAVEGYNGTTGFELTYPS